MRIKYTTLAILLFIIFFGGILGSNIIGLWKTEATKSAGIIIEGSSAGQKNPDDIKGSFSFLDISSNFDIPISDLQRAFEIKNVDSIEVFKCKDLKEYYAGTLSEEVGTGSIKLFVALYNGTEYEITEDTYLPHAAVALLYEKASLTKEQKEYIEAHTVKVDQ